jgi:hypothetical protein
MQIKKMEMEIILAQPSQRPDIILQIFKKYLSCVTVRLG